MDLDPKLNSRVFDLSLRQVCLKGRLDDEGNSQIKKPMKFPLTKEKSK